MSEELKFFLVPLIVITFLVIALSYGTLRVGDSEFGKFIYNEAIIRYVKDTKKEYLNMSEIDTKNEKISFTSKCNDGNIYYITVEKKMNK